jgi:hypothetical protein
MDPYGPEFVRVVTGRLKPALADREAYYGPRLDSESSCFRFALTGISRPPSTSHRRTGLLGVRPGEIPGLRRNVDLRWKFMIEPRGVDSGVCVETIRNGVDRNRYWPGSQCLVYADIDAEALARVLSVLDRL